MMRAAKSDSNDVEENNDDYIIPMIIMLMMLMVVMINCSLARKTFGNMKAVDAQS